MRVNPSTSSPQQANNSDQESHEMIQAVSKVSEYWDKTKRLETFRTWPQDSPMSPEDLAEVGLYYTGEKDKVRCFNCGIGLQKLKKVDNPILMHAQLSPMCAIVYMAKGMIDDDNELSEDASETDARLNTPAAMSCLQNGCTREEVSRAIDTHVSRHGERTYSGEELYLIIEETEESEVFAEGSSAAQVKAGSTRVAARGDDAGNMEEEKLQMRELIGCRKCSRGFDVMMDASWQHISTCWICLSQATVLPRFSAYAMTCLTEFVRVCEL